MFPRSFRRSLHAISLAGVTALAVVVPLSAAGASAAPSAASVITAAKTALAKQSSVHIVVSEVAGKTKTTVVVDLGKTSGTETITSGLKHVSIVVTPTDAYVKGSSSGLSGIMGLTAKQVTTVGTKSIDMKSGTTPYKSFKTSLTTGALQTFLPTAKGTTLLPVVSGSGKYVLRWTVKATSTSAKVTSVLTIASDKTSLPTAETVSSSTGTGHTKFSHWGETISLSVPGSGSTITYKKVFG